MERAQAGDLGLGEPATKDQTDAISDLVSAGMINEREIEALGPEAVMKAFSSESKIDARARGKNHASSHRSWTGLANPSWPIMTRPTWSRARPSTSDRSTPRVTPIWRGACPGSRSPGCSPTTTWRASTTSTEATRAMISRSDTARRPRGTRRRCWSRAPR